MRRGEAENGLGMGMDMSVGPLPRIGILVLGMHRAGTSLLTQILTQLGCDAPRTLIGASENNENGYWESRPVRDFNDRLLDAAQSRWDDWQPLDLTRIDPAILTGLRTEAAGLLASEFGASPLFVLKDPRICRMVPFWADVLATAGVAPRTIITLRNPVEVAASLHARGGYPPELAHMIWLRHMLDAEAATRGQPRAFTSYDSVLADWRRALTGAAATLDLSWPNDPQTVATGDIASDRLRHHQQSPAAVLDNPALTRWLRDTYRILAQWATDGESQDDQALLDSIKAELDASGPVFGPVLVEARDGAVRLYAADRRVAKLEAAKVDADALRIEARAQEQVAVELRRILDKTMADLRVEADRTRTLTDMQGRETLIRAAELARLADLLEVAETALTATRQEADAARIRTAVRSAAPFWLPRRIRVRQAMLAARKTGLFDADWYLLANQDVASAGINPLRHYVTSGMIENRAPNAGTGSRRGDLPS